MKQLIVTHIFLILGILSCYSQDTTEMDDIYDYSDYLNYVDPDNLNYIFTKAFDAYVESGDLDTGIGYCKIGNYGRAIDIIKEYLTRSDDNHGLAYYYLGVSEFGKKNYDKAKNLFFECFLKAEESSLEPWLAMGAIYLISSDTKLAEKQFKQLEKEYPGDNNVLREIARLYAIVDPVRYKKEIDKYVNKCMKQGNAGQCTAYLILGDMAHDNGPAASVGMYKKAIDISDFKEFEAIAKYAMDYEAINLIYAIDVLETYIRRNLVGANVNIARRLIDSINRSQGK